MSHQAQLNFGQVPDGVFTPTGASGPAGATGGAGGATGEVGLTGADGGTRIGDLGILYLKSEATVGNMSSGGTGIAMIFDNTDSIIDASFSHTDSTTEITINTTGIYRIHFTGSFRNTNTTLINGALLDFSIQRNPLGAGSFADLSGSLYHASIPGDTETNAWNSRNYSKVIYASLTATDTLRVRGVHIAGGSGVGRWQSGSIHIERVT